VLSYGLIAGMGMEDIKHSQPGLVLGLFMLKVEYDKQFMLKL
jgi:hypothetical protein